MNPNQWYGRSTEHTILSLTAQIGHKHEESRCLQAKFVPLCKDIITKLAAGMYAFLSGGRCKSMTRSTNGHIDHMGFYLGLETTTRVLAQACQVVKERSFKRITKERGCSRDWFQHVSTTLEVFSFLNTEDPFFIHSAVISANR